MRPSASQKDQKPRVAFLAHNMGGGGAERFVSHLLEGLKDELDIHLILFDDTIEYDLPEGQIVTFIEKGFKERGNLASIARLPLAALRLKKYCKANRIELVFSFLHRPNFTACIAKIAGLKIPLIMNECTYTPLWFNEGGLRGKIAKRLVSWLYPKADIILPVSEGIRKALVQHYGVKTRYQITTNIINRDEVKRKMAEPVDNLSFDRFTFINVASFSPMKGHRLMVEAFSRLNRKDVQLIFVGKGLKFDEVRDLVHLMGLEKDILFLGFQHNPFKYMGRSDCFLFASEFEGQGTVMMEAMACGLPVISTDCETGPRDLLAPGTESNRIGELKVEKGRYGVLVPVGDAQALSDSMREMLEDGELRDLYRGRAFEQIKDREKPVVIGKIRSIIFELLGRRDQTENKRRNEGN